MTDKNKRKSSFIKLLFNLALLIPNIFSTICNITSLIGFEARLAGRSILVILVCAILFACVLTSTWLCLLLALYLYLIALQWSVIAVLFTLMGVNILLLILIGFVIAKMKKNLLFPETSRECRSLCRIRDRD